MSELKSFWYIHGCEINFPSLSAAKQWMLNRFEDGGLEALSDDDCIYHFVGTSIVSVVYTYLEVPNRLRFYKPRRM